MSGPLTSLAEAAAGLRAESIPAELIELARHLHVATAGALRVGGGHGESALGAAGYCDAVFGGRVEGAVPVAWDDARGSTAGLLADTVVGLEVAARVGLAHLHGPRIEQVDLRPAAAAAVVIAGRQRGLDAAALTRALARVLTDVGTAPLAEWQDAPARTGAAARRALEGSGAVDDPTVEGGPFWADNPVPLPVALGGLGELWLSRTLALASGPGVPWTNTAVEAVEEVLRRHQRAAEKRLRADQVERIELRVNGWTARADAALPPTMGIATQVGALIATHRRSIADWTTPPEGAADVASRVELVADARLTLKGALELSATLGGLAAGGVPALRALLDAKVVPPPEPARLLDLLRLRPDRPLRALLRKTPSLACVDPQPWSLPVEVKIYTSRGGWWPERRSRPDGTLAGNDVEYNARARFADATEADRLSAPTGDAAAWVKELRA